MEDRLKGIEGTALIPLLARARATQRGDGFNDPWAVSVVERKSTEELRPLEEKHVMHGVMVRERWFDEQVQAFLDASPAGATVVNLGAGLDSRPFRLDRAKVRWIDVDLPEGIELRRQLYSEDDRHQFYAADILSPDFTQRFQERVQISGPVAFASSGVLMYLPAEGLESLFEALSKAFPGAPLWFDSSTPYFASRAHELSGGIRKGMFAGWGLEYNASNADVQALFPALTVKEKTSYFDCDIRWKQIPWLARLFLRSPLSRGLRRKFDGSFVSAELTGD